MEDNGVDSLYQLLKEVQLERFYNAIQSIDVTKVEHFENVLLDDLIGPQVGMGRPAARRLLEAAKKRNNKWKKNLLNIILPSQKERKDSCSEEKISGKVNNIEDYENIGLTCLISKDELKFFEKIGDGSFGFVMRGQWTQHNKTVKNVAVKILKQEVLSRALEDFTKEVNTMHQLNHPNLIKLYGVVLASPMMMVTELAKQGSLRSKLVKTMGKIAISSLFDFAIQIAKGMDYLEMKRLIHRDLAARNIFITENNKVKIGDFGLMRSVPYDEDYYTMSDNMKVPFPWCAYESLKYRQFSHSSDTWMFGVTLWEIFSFGTEPWCGLNGPQIVQKLEKNERLPLPESCSQRTYQVMMLCWKIEPKERPTFYALKNFFETTKPSKLKVVSDFNYDISHAKIQNAPNSEKKYLSLSLGDEVEIIDGRSENYWWKGQSLRTYEFGHFPRCVAKDLRNLLGNDISKPLKNSFIHTGHMDPLGKKSWGNPEYIEKMYLENPIEPQDMLGFETEDTTLVVLETRNGQKKITIKECQKKIDKITSLDEFISKKEENDQKPKEGILIDFDINSEIENIKPSSNNVFDNEITINKDLSEIKFNTQQILELYNRSNLDLKKEIQNDNQINEDDDYLDGIDFQQQINLENRYPLKDQTLKSIYPTLTRSTNEFAKPSFEDCFSKYYTPPFDKENTEYLQKNRYYSAVCSNCDLINPHYSTMPLSQQLNNETNSVCQCCMEFSSCHQNLSSNQCFDVAPTTNYIPACNGPTIYPSPASDILYPLKDSKSGLDTNNYQCNNNESTSFQTKICKDFIEELEANFSKLGQVKLKESNISSNVIFPIINPPPKSLKTRRPAPPPPTQKQK